MWYCKMYFPGRHEVIESDAFGTQGAPSQRKAFPFLESLLSFTELDIGKVAVALRCISDDLESLDRERVTSAMVRLGALAEMQSFFRVLYAKWFYFRSVGFENTEATVSGALDELRSLPEELPLYQKQIQRFFELVLDIDKAGREPSRQVMRYYHFDQPDQPSDPESFPFRLLTTRFEPVDGDACAPVLYTNTVADMISYSLQTCVERNITVRRCKNCGRYFCPDRPRQRGVLRPHTTRRSVQLPRDGRIPAVDAEAGGRPGVQGLSQGVQTPLCVDQGRSYQRQRVLCVERAGQRAEKEMRRRNHHCGGIPAVAEGVISKQRADRRLS